MAQAGKYGYIAPGDLTNGSDIPPEEPVFLLRAQDALAVQTLAAYFDLTQDAGCTDEFAAEIAGTRAAFIEWQRTHGIKIPD